MSKRTPNLTRLTAGLLVLMAAIAASTSAWAQDTDFLPVDQAFQPSLQRSGDTLSVTWKIADSYYLYRHALRFEPDNNAGLGSARIPAGDKHSDEFFGEVETYRDELTVDIPIADVSQLPPALTVTYQGCADAGLCYPPQTKTLEIPAAAAPTANEENRVQPAPAGEADSAASGFISEQDRIAGVLDNASLFWVVLSFLGLGILLAFTPCVLPMIPILSGIVVGSGERTSAARGFMLSSAYVLAMALAYTVFGVLAGLFGANLQALVQSPWTLVPFALVFVALAFSMFGFYELQLPSSWQTRLNDIGSSRRGDVAGAAIMGFVSALVVGPCLAPPLAGALLYIGASGNALLGGVALFALGLGMGLPLIALGTVGASVLPRAGAWMNRIKHLFGVILLGVAIWLLARILPGPVALAMWAALLTAYGVQLGAIDGMSRATGPRAWLTRAAALLVLAWGVLMLIGAAAGAGNPLQPLRPFIQTGAGNATTPAGDNIASPFRRIQNKDALTAALAAAARAGQPAVVDFYADWCVECVQLEHTVFADPQVRAALGKVTALQVDVTDYDAADRALLRELNVFGPPTMLFYRPDGREAADQRLVGTMSTAELMRHIQRASSP
ncbi:protein-disulfide reductase DsbD [Salinisphaera aquimarina]|uniref:Thiol:disulfide interchange protein DsbD n=1 Tax=Salinisphaera aquimarina TaxID=2094031 RepID=A0ABV7EQI3_9GAMM